MTLFPAIGFTTPALLLALLALPVLWWLLRAVPPAPVRRHFAGIALLLGLREKDPESQRTPWWLLMLRMAILSALIVAFAGPVLNPATRTQGNGPLLVVMDAGWAAGRDWPRRIDHVAALLDSARTDGRPVALRLLGPASAGPLVFHPADYWQERLPGLTPVAWSPPSEDLGALPDDVEVVWISDGVAGQGREGVLAQVPAPRIIQPDTPLVVLSAPLFDGQQVRVPAQRLGPPRAGETVVAIGRDPAGVERVLARAPLSFVPVEDGRATGEALFDVPPELRNRIVRFEVEGLRGAGAVSLADDGLQRRKVGLLSIRQGSEELALLSPLHYLRQALEPTADLVESAVLDDLLLAGPDVIVLPDLPQVTPAESDALVSWLNAGGLLLRFAGPRLAGAGAGNDAALGGGGLADDPLLPVRLRAGGRTVGGAMSWGDPRGLAPFAEGSPFVGLPVPEDVGIRAQVLAQPSPELAERTIAALADGTPLVTRRQQGAGQIVLFHVTANADWSNLPLSGLFVQMLDRLLGSTRMNRVAAAELVGTMWQPQALLDGFGDLRDADDRAAVRGEDLALAMAQPGPDTPPGLYDGPGQRRAINAIPADYVLTPEAWPTGLQVETDQPSPEVSLAPPLLVAALLLLAADAAATLALGGRLLAAMVLAMALVPAPRAGAQALLPGDARLLQATERVVLGAVSSGNAQVDAVALEGLRGLSNALTLRSSVEPGQPMAVDPETDDLSVFPFLYWPVLPESPLPGAEAVARINRYLRSGGMILFDTRDADTAALTGATTAAARRLRQIAAGLDIPMLEPVPADHVLTRTYYLLGDFPGRYQGGTVWVEAAPADAEQAEGMPFRMLNDGVSPVVIGANDWASAWAVDERGAPSVPVGRGSTGERQREIALRFGINLIMYVLSGNYKSDQVHVPALLERLGQ
ncbi:MAG: DUF4159 domain-containing protein [Paracoccaceae bacterium]